MTEQIPLVALVVVALLLAVPAPLRAGVYRDRRMFSVGFTVRVDRAQRDVVVSIGPLSFWGVW